jgi:hypothetical protein
MDKLDKMIADKEAEGETLKQEIAERAERYERLLIELKVLKDAAKARPAATPKANVTAPKKPKERAGKRKGRQAGDISLEWRGALKALHLLHKRVNYNEIHSTALSVGIDTKMPNVRERVRSMVENGLLSGSAEQGFWVTKDAVSRFGLDQVEAAAA